MATDLLYPCFFRRMTSALAIIPSLRGRVLWGMSGLFIGFSAFNACHGCGFNGCPKNYTISVLSSPSLAVSPSSRSSLGEWTLNSASSSISCIASSNAARFCSLSASALLLWFPGSFIYMLSFRKEQKKSVPDIVSQARSFEDKPLKPEKNGRELKF